MDPRYQPMTRWSNAGLFVDRLGDEFFHCGIQTPWGNLIIKPWANRLFSERYGYTRTLKLFGLCVTWVRLRRLKD